MKTTSTRSTPRTSALPLLVVVAAQLLAACSSTPPTPTWQLESKGAMERSVAAYLEGKVRVESAERTRARAQLAATGRPDLVAHAELLHCAARAASLVFEACSAFDALRADATEAQRTYADYLQGHVAPARIPLLPAAQQAAASRSANDPAALQGIEDPLSLLVAAGVAFKTGKANPALLAQAVDAASAQGWRRPLLAWLGVQLQRATLAGQTAEVERLQRRIALVQNTSTTAPPTPPQ